MMKTRCLLILQGPERVPVPLTLWALMLPAHLPAPHVSPQMRKIQRKNHLILLQTRTIPQSIPLIRLQKRLLLRMM